MPATFSWLDYSEAQRRQMQGVIDQFAQKDTRDELGIGSVRDSFADRLFPGTSVIQTRAGYLLFVPWMYRRLEDKGYPAAEMDYRRKQAEVKLIDALEASGSTQGNIGREAREKLQRFPSNVYWLALHKYGLRAFAGSQDQYHRSIDGFHARHRDHAGSRAEDGEFLGAEPHNWHAGLPEPPDGFPGGASFDLRPADANYLRERILAAGHGSMLGFLMAHGRSWEQVDFPWEHPQVGEMPAELRETLDHARKFSVAIHGAALLYNLMLAEMTKSADLAEDYRDRFADWVALVRESGPLLAGWDRARFWTAAKRPPARVSVPTQQFVNEWLDDVLGAGEPAKIAESTGARDRIRFRERALKGPLARLENELARNAWSGDAGTGRLDYRWGKVQTIVLDILRPLAAEAGDA